MGLGKKACQKENKHTNFLETIADDKKSSEAVPLEREVADASVEISSPPRLGFARLKMGKIADIRNRHSTTRLSAVGVSLRRFGAGFNDDAQPVFLGGLFSEEVFKHYDVDRDGLLCAAELGSLLRDHGMCLDYSGASRILELIAGSGARGINAKDFPRSVMHVVEKRRGSGGEAAEVLQCVFGSYDANKSGMLEVPEYTLLLNHLGRRPKKDHEWADQNLLVSSCRRDASPGPLTFQEFVVLARKISTGSY